ncbi:MAG: cyclic-phosphate processing receiver domain-containing protein [Actinomycetes bacterium]
MTSDTESQGLKLRVDDLRDPPDTTWVIARDYGPAIEILATGRVRTVSLDHDLGPEETGLDICLWMSREGIWPKTIVLHTANPLGREDMYDHLVHHAPRGTHVYHDWHTQEADNWTD